MAKELPILFTAEMIRAKREGRKTVTRRLNGLKEINKEPDRWQFSHILCNPPEAIFEDLYDTVDLQQKEMRGQKIKFVKLPYQVGDLLWVKETFWLRNHGNTYRGLGIDYKAGGVSKHILKPKGVTGLCKWKSPRFMPKWAARTWLEVVSVRAERSEGIWAWRYELKEAAHG